MTTKLGSIIFIRGELSIWGKAGESIKSIAKDAKRANARVVGKGAESWKLKAGRGIWVEYKEKIGVKG